MKQTACARIILVSKKWVQSYDAKITHGTDLLQAAEDRIAHKHIKVSCSDN